MPEPPVASEGEDPPGILTSGLHPAASAASVRALVKAETLVLRRGCGGKADRAHHRYLQPFSTHAAANPPGRPNRREGQRANGLSFPELQKLRRPFPNEMS